jgi:hypothetical protein
MRTKNHRNRNAAAAVSATAIALLGAYPLSNVQASDKSDAAKAEERMKERAKDAEERSREKAKKDRERDNETDDDDDDHSVTTVAPTTLVPTTVVATTQPPVTTTQPPVTTTQPPVTTTQPPVTTTQPPVTTTQPPVTTTQPPVTTTTTIAPPMPAVKASQQFVSMTVGGPIKMDTVVSNSGTASANVSVVITLSSSGSLPHFLEAKGTVGTWTCSAYIEVPVPPVSYTCTGTLAAGTSGTVTVSSGSKINGAVGTEVFAGVVVNPGGSANGTSAKYV